GSHAQIPGIGHIGIGINTLHIGIKVSPHLIPGLIKVVGILSIVELVATIVIYKRIKAFIHPWIASFITANDHWKPVVSKLMVGNPPKIGPCGFPITETYAGIFHTIDFGCYVYGSRVGIFKPHIGVILNGMLGILGRPAPSIIAITLYRIDRLCHCGFTTGQVYFGGIPNKRL